MRKIKFLLTILFIIYSTQASALQLNKLQIQMTGGAIEEFDVEVVNTPAAREIGLMFRNKLPENQGMLFVFDKNRPVNMWMKNTYIPLDILFINKNAVITNIAENTSPHSLKNISSSEPVVAALEINAMISNKLGIKAGDKIVNFSEYYKGN